MYQFLSENLIKILIDFKLSEKPISILTGAGISAASGIPTFRGKDGFWVVGSKNYKPEKMGTMEMFRENPLAIWKWFIYIKTICEKAKPNDGHFAIVGLEKIFQSRFYLITQNVDGLHERAGNSPDKIFSIHGTLDFMRCGELCTSELFPFPAIRKDREENFLESEIIQLKCPNCVEFARPNVLWFDEFYNELFYKSETTVRIANESGLLIIVGTSGSTTLPSIIFSNAIKNNIPIIDINTHENPFSKFLTNYEKGFSIQAESALALKEILDLMTRHLTQQRSN